MKSNYEKYMQEVRDMKDQAYHDFKASGFTKYSDYLHKELKDQNLFHQDKIRKSETSIR